MKKFLFLLVAADKTLDKLFTAGKLNSPRWIILS